MYLASSHRFSINAKRRKWTDAFPIFLTIFGWPVLISFFLFVGFRIIPFDLSNGDHRYNSLIKEMDNAIDRACSSHPSKPVFLMGHGMVRKDGDGLLPDQSLARVWAD